jgi:glycosyltransferase involved in cell wall biosynthesis
VFTLAPDPHRPIHAAEASGALDRRTFALADARDALWFRAHLVERLAEGARELVLFPHAGGAEELEELTGSRLLDGPPRHTVIAEGIDTGRTDAAAALIARADDRPAVLGDLQAAIARLPRERHGLPLVVSAGRLHPIKGMSRLVAAFADSELAERANLVIVGGDLDDPTAVEAAELARIRSTLDDHPGLSDRVVLLGQRTTEEVALVLAAARAGWGSLIGPAGAYACGSLKEEFGLAIVEAMAAGLPVVAPHAGGPATYVHPGVDGVLTDTSDPTAIAAAACHALDLSAVPGTADRTRAKIDTRYTLQRMARDLTAVYRISAAARTLSDEVAPTEAAA